MILSNVLAATLLASSAAAHAIFQQLYVNGVDQGHLTGIRVPNYDGPITDVTSSSVICNGSPNPLNTPYPSTIIDIPAGASVTAEWHHTLSGADASDTADPIDPSHKGPIMAYLAKVPSALQTDVTGLGWFKIWEDGLTSDGKWAVDRMIANKGKVTFTIPTCIAPGNYFLRVELIALHGASSYPGAQLYMECAQINITGGGSASPPTVSFPGAYSGSDPGITIKQVSPSSYYSVVY
ncbi:glycoside hydrolase [Serendipita vermifera]|nr:glycoside hydrolase [Serendipita vermifera]